MKEQLDYLKKLKKNKRKIIIFQLLIGLSFLIIWEILSRFNIINSFFYSSPTKIIYTIIDLYKNNNLFNNIFITLYELIISFILGSLLGFIIAIIFYSIPILKKIFDPYLTLLNSLPKVALGPLLIIWIGANTKSIIVMALLINLIVSIIGFYNGFINTDTYKIKLLKSFGATKSQILINLVIPSSLENIFNSNSGENDNTNNENNMNSDTNNMNNLPLSISDMIKDPIILETNKDINNIVKLQRLNTSSKKYLSSRFSITLLKIVLYIAT